MVLIDNKTGIPDGYVRFVFRVYFLISFLILAFVGSQLVKCVNKVRILRGQPLTMAQMTGWFRIMDILKCVLKMRRLPGGFLMGSFMVLAAIMAPVSDLLTAALVTRRTGISRCDFERGVVVNTTLMTWVAPPSTGFAALIVQNAQMTSDVNECPHGIYIKADQNPDFCANHYEDVLGYWDCSDVSQDITFPASQTIYQVATKLNQLGLLDQKYASSQYARRVSDNFTTQLIWWSPSAGNSAETDFAVKVSIDQGYQYDDDKVMKNYACHISADSPYPDEVKAILASMGAESALAGWISDLPSVIYYGDKAPPRNDTTKYLEMRLNSMTMVQGASALAGRTADQNPLGGDGKIGCLILQLSIHNVVLALAAAVFVNVVGFILLWLILLLKIGRKGKEMKPFPNNQLTWMLHAAREGVFGGQQHSIGRSEAPSKERKLRDWKFDWASNGTGGRCLRLLRNEEQSGANIAVFSPVSESTSGTLFSPLASDTSFASPPMKNTSQVYSPPAPTYPQPMIGQHWTQQHQYEIVPQDQGGYGYH